VYKRRPQFLAGLAGFAIFILGAAPAWAHTTVIAELGSFPLLGTSRSTAELRARVARNEGTLSAAATKAGLTPSQYAQFRAAIDTKQLAWVTVPRHLDVMTWQANGNVYALHDVEVPASTHGWEVDIPHGHQMIAVYMPAKCGNLSVVRRAIPVLAQHPKPKQVMALQTVEPPPVAVAPPVVVEAPPPAPVDTPPAAVAESEFPPAPVVAKHGLNLLPLLFGLAAIAGASSSNGGSPNLPPVGACP
jgi:hypothetical protein